MTRIEHWLAGAPEPRRDLEILIGHITGRTRAWLYAHSETHLGETEEQALESLLERRRSGEPIAYLTGRKEFFGIALTVSCAVLIPRPETELLVELALARLTASARVLDLGTGSGAIALALAQANRGAGIRITAVDRSADALAIARRNATEHGCTIELLQSDWYEGLKDRTFDLIASNPPYVATGDPHLRALTFEPVQALIAGPMGLAALTEVVAGAPRHLEKGGLLIVEHGHDQGEAVRNLFIAAGFDHVATHRDLARLERATLGTR